MAAFERGKVRRLSHQNDAWLKDVLLGTTEEFTSTSKDGTDVHGLIVKPPTFRDSQKYQEALVEFQRAVEIDGTNSAAAQELRSTLALLKKLSEPEESIKKQTALSRLAAGAEGAIELGLDRG